MKSIVTGAAGFVGSSIVDSLLEKGHEVIGIDCFLNYYPRDIKESNLANAKQNKKFIFYEISLLEDNLEGILEGANYIYHQAAQAGVRASWGEYFSTYTNNNILATQKILECCKKPAIKETLKKVVYASSSSVYGDAESLPTLEEALPCPLSPYGVTKLAAEHLMVLYAKEFNVPTVSLRYFTVFGPRQRPDMAFNKFIKAGLLGNTIEIYGDGEQSRDFTYIDDIVNANIAAAELNTKSLVFNIGGGSRITVNETLKLIESILGSKLKIEYQSRQIGDAKHTASDTTKARKELRYTSKFNVELGLANEVKWLEGLLK